MCVGVTGGGAAVLLVDVARPSNMIGLTLASLRQTAPPPPRPPTAREL